MISYDIKVKNFKIKNFRIFENADISFSENSFNSFLGRNGTGKTTLLEAINICLSENTSKFNNVKSTDFYSEKPIEFIVEFNKPFFFSCFGGGYNRLLPCKKFHKIIEKRDRKSIGDFFSPQFEISTDYELLEYESIDSVYKKLIDDTADLIPDKAKIACSVKKDVDQLQEGSEDYYIFTGKNGSGYSLRKYEITAAKKIFYPKVFYFDTERDRELLPQYNTLLADIVEELDWRYNRTVADQAKKEVIKKHYYDLHESILESCKYKNDLLKPTLKTLKYDFHVDFDTDNLNFFFLDYNQPFKNAIFGHRSAKDRIINIKQCGSGISILVALSLLVNIAQEGKNPIIILIDEPELHLHADLQKNLFTFLKGKKFQSFVSTHSHLFVDQQSFNNNFKLELLSNGAIDVKSCNQIHLANVLFGLFGNHLSDLYVPENLILIEGKYDKKILSSCLELIGSTKSFLLLDCGGNTEIPNEGGDIETFFSTYFNQETWYKKYIQDKLRIIIDGDVGQEKVNRWIQRFGLDDSHVTRLSVPCLEFLYPESLVKQLTDGIDLKDGSIFSQKSKEDIVKIILSDEKVKEENKDDRIQKEENKISKQRLTEYVAANLTKEILLSEESKKLKELAEWIDNF